MDYNLFYILFDLFLFYYGLSFSFLGVLFLMLFYLCLFYINVEAPLPSCQFTSFLVVLCFFVV